MDDFFNKNGTLQGLMDFASAYNGLKTDSRSYSGGALGKIVNLVMSLLSK